MSEHRRTTFLGDAVRVAPVSPDWRAGARMALVVVVPVAFGEVVGLAPTAMMATLVAINVGVADEPAAYGVRCRLMVTAAILYLGVIAVATAVEASDLAVLVVSVGVAGLAALAAGLGVRGAKLGLLTGVVWTIFAYGDLPEPEVWIRVAAAAAGAAWALVLYLWPWPIRAARSAARSVGAVWAALAALARRPVDAEAVRTVRWRLDAAAETLTHTASAPAALSGQVRAADALTTAVSSIRRAAARQASTDAWLQAVGDLASESGAQDRSAILARATDALEQAGDAPSIVALGRVAQRSLSDPTPLGPRHRWSSARVRLVDVARRLINPGARQWSDAARYAAAFAVAGALALWGPFENGYWVPLTVLIVLAPTANATLAKGVQRTVGTVIGVGLAIVVADIVPAGSVWHYAVLGLLAGIIGVLIPLNYGIGVIFITSTIIVLLSWPAAGVDSVAAARLVDTLVGAAIALAVGVFVWPHHPRDDVRAKIADVLRATARFADAAIRPPCESDPAPHARRVATEALNTASAIVAEATADWSRPPPSADARLLEAVHITGREVLDVRVRIRGATFGSGRDDGRSEARGRRPARPAR